MAAKKRRRKARKPAKLSFRVPRINAIVKIVKFTSKRDLKKFLKGLRLLERKIKARRPLAKNASVITPTQAQIFGFKLLRGKKMKHAPLFKSKQSARKFLKRLRVLAGQIKHTLAKSA